VFAGTGFHLGAIQGDMAQVHQPRRLAEPHGLNNQPSQAIEMTTAEVVDPAVVR
jgi:hypothetical protein